MLLKILTIDNLECIGIMLWMCILCKTDAICKSHIFAFRSCLGLWCSIFVLIGVNWCSI